MIIFGVGKFAETVSVEGVSAFTVDEAYLTSAMFRGKPVIAFEEIQEVCPPETDQMFVAVRSSVLREKKSQEARAKGYELIGNYGMNAFGVVAEFERRVAEYAGSKYAVAVDCCTNAIFLCLKYLGVDGEVVVPARTYVSVPMAVIHAGGKVRFEDFEWSGVYQLKPFPIFDGAKRFRRGMYEGGLHCLSFHTKKILNIGRGGMILTDDEEAVRWLKKARYDGREERHYGVGEITTLGFHMYLMPDQAARGLTLLDAAKDFYPDQEEAYPDLRTMPVFK